MKRFEHFLLPIIIIGMLVLSGCQPAPGSKAYNSTLRKQPSVQAAEGSTSAQAPGASFQQTGTIPTDKAVVYIYHSGGSNHRFFLQANGKDITSLRKGLYYAYVTAPGVIEFKAMTMGTYSLTLDTKAGQSYYIKGSVPPGFSPTPSLVVVSPEVGTQEIANYQLVSP